MSSHKAGKEVIPVIMPGAEPFFFQGDDTGVLLIHGFTGTPREMRGMGAFLSQQGYTCLGIRLSGHATRVEDMQHITWQDWYSDVLDGIALLRTCTRNIFLAGLSMGGVLSLFTVANVPDICGVIAMSTPYTLSSDWRLKYVHLLKLVVRKTEKGPPDWVDKTAVSQHLEYPYFPTAGIDQLNSLMVRMRQDLSKITVPTCLMHSREDQGVPFENMEKIYKEIGNTRNEMIAIERGSHTMTCDSERQTVYQRVHEFIQKVLAN